MRATWKLCLGSFDQEFSVPGSTIWPTQSPALLQLSKDEDHNCCRNIINLYIISSVGSCHSDSVVVRCCWKTSCTLAGRQNLSRVVYPFMGIPSLGYGGIYFWHRFSRLYNGALKCDMREWMTYWNKQKTKPIIITLEQRPTISVPYQSM